MLGRVIERKKKKTKTDGKETGEEQEKDREGRIDEIKGHQMSGRGTRQGQEGDKKKTE